MVGGPSCFAYMSFAPKDVVIEELSPPLQISQGFSMQGALNLFDAKMKFKMSFFETRLQMELDASPLEFGRIKVCLTCSRLMFTACVGEHKVYRVIDKEEELIQIGGWGRRRLQAKPVSISRQSHGYCSSGARGGAGRRVPAEV